MTVAISASMSFVVAETVPATMGAWVTTLLGGQKYEAAFKTPALGVLHKKFADLPTTCEVLVKVMTSSVNPCDRAADSAFDPKPMGSDLSGIVMQVGTGCIRLKVGDQVRRPLGGR